MRRRKRSWFPRLVGLALVASLAGSYVWLRAATTPPELVLQTARVGRETLDRTVSATGVIRPMVGAEIDVGSRVSGIVRSLPVQVGDAVNQGDLLARIDPTEFQAQIAEAQADLALAEAQLGMALSSHQRATTLAAEGIVPTVEVESAARDLEVVQARVALQETRVNSAIIRMGYTDIRAPVRGVIADVTTREGETVAASFAAPTFVTIVDLDRLEVQAYVDETDIGRIFIGQRAEFSVDTYPEASFTATVTAVNPKAALQNGVVNYIVRLRFDRGDGFVLRPEMTAHVELQLEQRADVLTVPRKTIRRHQGQQFVKVQRGGAWVDQAVKVGWRTDRRVEIQQGLEEGETLQLNQE
jgi:RND family efflux transporter MFP subunit